MATTRSPLRLDADLLLAATAIAETQSRSAAQQISHWARIGRELERTPGVSVEELAAVLRGAADYDALPARAQAIVRGAWAERMRALRDGLRLDRDLRDAGHAYAELDERERVAVRDPGARAPIRARAARRVSRKKKR